MKLQTDEFVKTEHSQLENAKDQESLDHLSLQEISDDTKIAIKLEELDYTSEVPETHLKSEFDDRKLEKMDLITKDEVEIDQNM